MYNKIENNEDDLKPKVKEKLIENKELAELSRFLGTINLEVPIDEKVEELKTKEWNKEEVFSKFKELNFNRFIERFNLKSGQAEEIKNIDELFKIEEISLGQKEEIEK